MSIQTVWSILSEDLISDLQISCMCKSTSDISATNIKNLTTAYIPGYYRSNIHHKDLSTNMSHP